MKEMNEEPIYKTLADQLADLLESTGEPITIEDVKQAYMIGFNDGDVHAAFGRAALGPNPCPGLYAGLFTKGDA